MRGACILDKSVKTGQPIRYFGDNQSSDDEWIIDTRLNKGPSAQSRKMQSRDGKYLAVRSLRYLDLRSNLYLDLSNKKTLPMFRCA